MKVPFLDLKSQYRIIESELSERFDHIFDSTGFVLGEEVERFETDFALYLEAKYCVAVSSGTAALHLALLSSGIGINDEVITVPNTFIATAEAISYIGAKPVFVDVDPQTLLISSGELKKAITPKTKAIIPVHLFGQPCDMASINSIAKANNLIVIEDACQAHGAELFGTKVGTFGKAAAFSFYPGKNLGAYGEAGALITNDEEIYKRAKMYRDHGQAKKYYHELIGYNYRMDAFQGAVLNAKLKHLNEWNEQRRRNADLYRKYLSDAPIEFIEEVPEGNGVYHLMVIKSKNRDELKAFLEAAGIQTRIHYPIPIHLQNAYKELGYRNGDFPISEHTAQEILSLPMFPEISEEQIIYTSHRIKKFYEGKNEGSGAKETQEAYSIN